ncbi:MAG TPA: 4-(cytidine 5'-diphospho)-2-C-methyl-D-erythritol kinase, partial [Proteobacteria bacterium]|nr:4-(cytidine 5'-diphospho)-2-C-methyl-D-erythritol kinase [Pseudomonadota bacterium]
MIRLLAPAKLNLTLQVLGKRPDGYHSIESLVQKVDFYDRIMLESSSDGKITLRCSDPTLPTDSGNIVQRAAELLRKSAGIPARGVRIHLDK